MPPTSPFRDRRSRRRFVVNLPLHYKIMTGSPVISAGTGEALNISSSGIAFTSEGVFHPGTLIELTLSWPALLHEDIPIKLVMRGSVVRCDGRVVAVKIHHHEFRTRKK